MKKLIIGIILGLLVVLGGIQLIPVDQNNPPVTSDIPTSPEVKTVLKRSCYDCHSNEVVYPWYSRIAPVSWLVKWDVEDGREELNFSTWNAYDPKKQVKKRHETWETVAEGEMPPWYYTVLHRQARLSPEDRQVLRMWAGTSERVKRDGEK